MSRPNRPQRKVSQTLAALRSREEQETLLGEEEVASDDGCVREPNTPVPGIFAENPHADLEVYKNIHRIRRLVLASIDDPYSSSQLREPRLNVLIVRPLVDRLYDPDDCSIVYCLLVNRARFLREQQYHSHAHTVNTTRADLCELVAAKILRRHDEETPGRQGLLLLANIMVAGFEPFQNAPPQIVREHSMSFERKVHRRMGYERLLAALEIAIISESKFLLSGSAAQKVVDAVNRGRIVYTPNTWIDIIPDHYKHKNVSLYDPRKANILNQYRLVVPRTRNIIEIVQFLVLLVLYILTMFYRDHTRWTVYEICFIIYGGGWCLDEFASILEHGWQVHTQNLWAFLDVSFLFIYLAFFFVRMHGAIIGNIAQGRHAHDILAISAPILITRLAFNLMPENLLFISLRAMMGEFVVLTLLAGWCFVGFLLALMWLEAGNHHLRHSADAPRAVDISKWLLWIWFGLDGTGLDVAPQFHFFLGPLCMILFAFLGNTLFVTIVVAILSNTFSKIAVNASSEIQFRRAVLTFEGVKSDALFSYRPPFNLLAILILVPLKHILTPRWFHKINVFAIRVLNAPILLLIALYERRYLWKPVRRGATVNNGPSKRGFFWSMRGAFSVHGDIQQVFDHEPPQEIVDEIEEEEDLENAVLEHSFQRPNEAINGAVRKRRFSQMTTVPHDDEI